MKDWMNTRMENALSTRCQRGTLRRLPFQGVDTQHANAPSPRHQHHHQLDFSSNDYLGLAHSHQQRQRVDQVYKARFLGPPKPGKLPTWNGNRHGTHAVPSLSPILGASGSRLLSGDSSFFHVLEFSLAKMHNRPAALLSNSGYDANLTIVSSLQCDFILYDAYIHNSLQMGLRLWQAKRSSASISSIHKSNSDSKTKVGAKISLEFRHNDVDDYTQKLQSLRGKRVVVLIESVYSMDGDIAPLQQMLDLAQQYDAKVIVDEAHGLGVYGRSPSDPKINDEKSQRQIYGGTGVLAALELEDHPALVSSIHTFGKAAGCHGAVICCSKLFKEYLVNYGFPLIYSTAMPFHSLVAIQCAYETFTGGQGMLLRQKLFSLVKRFRTRLGELLERIESSVYLLPSTSPIQALMLPGNEECTVFCSRLFHNSQQRIRLFPIKSPTVPVGQERVRIILHSHNTAEQVEFLVQVIIDTLAELRRPRRSRL